jgi:hypothetical protein
MVMPSTLKSVYFHVAPVTGEVRKTKRPLNAAQAVSMATSCQLAEVGHPCDLVPSFPG